MVVIRDYQSWLMQKKVRDILSNLFCCPQLCALPDHFPGCNLIIIKSIHNMNRIILTATQQF